MSLLTVLLALSSFTSGNNFDTSSVGRIVLFPGETNFVQLRDISAETGYNWTYDIKDTSIVRIMISRHPVHSKKRTAVMPTDLVYAISGSSPGHTTIVFELRNSNDSDLPPSQRRTYNVLVKPFADSKKPQKPQKPKQTPPLFVGPPRPVAQ